jgi:hypothetical protein
VRSRPLQRVPAQSSGMNWSGLHLPTACASRCSQPLGAFIRPEPAGLVSCRIRSWGHPPEPCSSRAAVRCSQRRSPLDVRDAFRVWHHARVRHPVQRFRLKTERVALLGIFPSGVFSLFAIGPVLAEPPLVRLLPRTVKAETTPLQGFSRKEHGWSLSRLPTPMGFVASCSVTTVRPTQGFWSRPLRSPGYVTAPLSALLRIPVLLCRSRRSRNCRPHLLAPQG